MKVQSRVVVVTGGGNGIGRQLVLELLRRGARVAAVDLRQESLDQTTELAGAGHRLATFVTDITNRQAVQDLPDQVIGAHGLIDGIINCAGIIQPFLKLNDLDYEAIDRVINVNLYGTIHVSKALLPHLLERPVAHLANVSSMGGFLPVPGQTIYGASKAGVKLLTEGLYAELLHTNVKVSVIMPGAVATEITANSGIDIPGGAEAAAESEYPTTSAEDAARIILDGIESDHLHIYVGRDSRMMNLANRLAPRQATHLIYRQMRELLQS
ncbi:MAG: SDR family oxidoreductase [Acidimicrobiia bacterium]